MDSKKKKELSIVLLTGIKKDIKQGILFHITYTLVVWRALLDFRAAS